MTTRSSGMRGEDIALDHLSGLGYELVERNYRSRYGEVDLIMQDGDALVFVEVKLRRNASHGTPLEFVTSVKQKRLRTTAELYLAEHDDHSGEARFDVVGIVDGAMPTLEHVRDAF